MSDMVPEDYEVEEVDLPLQEAIDLIVETYGEDVLLAEEYYEAAITMIFPSATENIAYLVVKSTREVTTFPFTRDS